MRNLVLLLLFTMPPLVACSAAYAKTATEIGKPVCMHFDDAAKAAPKSDVAPAPANQATAATLVASSASSAPAIAGSAASTLPKSGGTSAMMRPRTAPRWQTFLPGMFK